MINQTVSDRYLIEERIGEGEASHVYRATCVETGEVVAIKILRPENISHRTEDIIRFQMEVRAVSQLTHPNIISVYEVGELDNTHYIATEYLRGTNLDEILRLKPLSPLSWTLRIIEGIALALEHIHERHVVHREVYPGNVLVLEDGIAQDGDQVKLINFGLSQIREFDTPRSLSKTLFILSYMAPELTGLLHRSADERSDLYSLGILFYHLLTGTLPFQGDTVGAMIHQQINRSPLPPTQIVETVPTILERIVLKLLEKEPESRYQSAKGFLHDLTRYKRGESGFLLGLEDSTLRINYKTRMVGREEELNLLRRLFEKSKNGHRVACFVSGDPGVGKTRLLEEFRDHVFANEDTAIEGNCYLGTNQKPYGLFKETLSTYIRLFQKYPEEKKEFIKSGIAESIGKLGRIILALNPQMEEIIGESPSLISIEPEIEKRRFLMVASRFFRRLAVLEQGLVVLLDDLQWSDLSSLELLNEIMRDLSTEPIFIIGLYRKGEVEKDHYINRLITGAGLKSFIIRDVRLAPFNREIIQQLVSGVLRERGGEIELIAEVVHRKSGGNPLLTIETLRQLISEKVVLYQKSWRVDKRKAGKVEALLNATGVPLNELSRLSEEENSVLSFAAVIGNVFDIELVFELSEGLFERTMVVAIVDKAVDLQLLEEYGREKGKLRFAHDRVKEAFYFVVDEKKRREIHLKIATVLRERNQDSMDEALFDVAYHFLMSGHKRESLRYCYPAGKKAMMDYANDEALYYLLSSLDILEEIGETVDIKLGDVNEAIGTIYLTIGKYDEAIDLLTGLLTQKDSLTEKAALYKKISEAYFKMGDWDRSIRFGQIGLNLLGERTPLTKITVVASIVKELMIHAFHHLFPKALSRGGKGGGERYKIIIQYYHSLGWVYGLSDTLKFVRTMSRMLNLSGRFIARSKEHALSMTGYGILYMVIPLFNRAIVYHQNALALFKSLGDDPGVGESLQFIGLYYQWRGEYKRSIHQYQQGKDVFEKIGDVKGIEFCYNNLSIDYMYLSDYPKAEAANQQFLTLAEKLNDTYGICSAYDTFAEIYHECGDYKKTDEYLRKSLTLSKENNIGLIHCTSHINQGRLLLEQGDIDSAETHFLKAKYLYDHNSYFDQYTTRLFSFLARVYIEKFKRDEASLGRWRKIRELRKIKRICARALKKTRQWVTYHANSLLVNAHYYALKKNITKAEEFFHLSIDHNRFYSREFELGTSLYEFGQFLQLMGRDTEAQNLWREAYSIFRGISAQKQAEKLMNQLGLDEAYEKDPLQRYIQRFKHDQRSDALVELSQYLRNPHQPEELLNKILSLSLEVSSAQGLLLFARDERSGEIKLQGERIMELTSWEVESYSMSVVQRVLESGKTIITDDVITDAGERLSRDAIHHQIKSILCFPVAYKGRIWGACYLYSLLSGHHFSEENMDILSALITQATLSIESESERVHCKAPFFDESYFQTQCDALAITKREREVLEKTINGKTNRDIGTELSISISTVKKHLYSIYKKTKARDRERLIEIFLTTRSGSSDPTF